MLTKEYFNKFKFQTETSPSLSLYYSNKRSFCCTFWISPCIYCLLSLLSQMNCTCSFLGCDHVRVDRRSDLYRAIDGECSDCQMGWRRSGQGRHLRCDHRAERLPILGQQGRIQLHQFGVGCHESKAVRAAAECAYPGRNDTEWGREDLEEFNVHGLSCCGLTGVPVLGWVCSSPWYANRDR